MMAPVTPFVAGLLFAVGPGVGGMILPGSRWPTQDMRETRPHRPPPLVVIDGCQA
jgi:hypothetical protein